MGKSVKRSLSKKSKGTNKAKSKKSSNGNNNGNNNEIIQIYFNHSFNSDNYEL